MVATVDVDMLGAGVVEVLLILDVATLGLTTGVVVGVVDTIDVVVAIIVEELVALEVTIGVVIVGGTTGVTIIGATGAGFDIDGVVEAIQLPSDWLN